MYKFNEDNILNEIKDYIDSSYDSHYSSGNIQASEFIEDAGHGIGFTIGNVIKYAQRYGKKHGHNRDDLLKIVHYAIMAIAIHDNKISMTDNLVDSQKEIVKKRLEKILDNYNKKDENNGT